MTGTTDGFAVDVPADACTRTALVAQCEGLVPFLEAAGDPTAAESMRTLAAGVRAASDAELVTAGPRLAALLRVAAEVLAKGRC